MDIALAPSLLEAALLDQDPADQDDHGDAELRQQARPGQNGVMEGCTLTSIVDPVNVDQTGWKSSQGVQGSGVFEGGGVKSPEPSSECVTSKQAALPRNVTDREAQTEQDLEKEMNILGGPCHQQT